MRTLVLHPARRLRVAFALLAVGAIALSISAPAGASSGINGTGSTYVALAMQQWVADAQTNGLSVNYLATGSPDGLSQFGHGVVDFAATEAEFSSLGGGIDEGAERGYQYVPDVAGAVAIMYNVDDPSGKKNTTLHLSRLTVAKIFMGFIKSWDDPAITADNKGYPLDPHPISVVYRSQPSGTTALFYDFVALTDPGDYAAWAAQHGIPTTHRIVSLPSDFAPLAQGLGGSDQIAQHVASDNGKWSIAYDEFGYAKTYNVPAAWIQNQSGNFVLPFAQNIASALKSATLHADLSQDLSGVYVSPAADAYPISAYSYLVTQSAVDPARPTCKGPYANASVADTLAKWMRYIACDGQVNMAQIGYSPLPPNLSNEVTKSIARMTGGTPEVLTAANCKNPTFGGSLGGPPPPVDPIKNVPPHQGGSGGGGNGAGTSAGNGATSTGTKGATAAPKTNVTTAAASTGAADATTDTTAVAADTGPVQEDAAAALDGSDPKVAVWRPVNPVAYTRPDTTSGFPLPLLFVLSLVILPPLIGGAVRTRRRT